MEKTVVELFAGVGGFRIGLNNVKLLTDGTTHEGKTFNFLWANQWEPSTKIQPAFDCYKFRFFNEETISNVDITKVNKEEIPNHTLLVGGFPCQDYSVARSLSNEKGIEGKKGVLWWQINEIIKVKTPPFILLENVDRLLKSPSTQRGRDFAVMLRCLFDLGYGVEWRVINSADYGHPQKRKRVYIFAFRKNTKYYKHITTNNESQVFQKEGIFAKTFPISSFSNLKYADISKSAFKDLIDISSLFSETFENAGYMYNGKIYTTKVIPVYTNPIMLKEILEKKKVDEHFYLDTQYEKFEFLKGHKRILRNKNGIQYFYSEGKMNFPDDPSLPGRTMLTSEGTVNRSTHVVKDLTERLRFITPLEAERLNEFPDNWTNTGMTVRKRYFMMGNALVTGVVKKLGKEISIIIDKE